MPEPLPPAGQPSPQDDSQRDDDSVAAHDDSFAAHDDSAAADAPRKAADEGPGWMPAVVAGGLLLLAAGFFFCGFTTWVLFQKRSELAARTLRRSLIPAVQQSQLAPAEKQPVVEMLSEVADQAESGELENWQASGIMNRLVRAPILEWGDLAAVEAWIAADTQFTDQERQQAELQLARLRAAVAAGQATVVDLNDVLAPVLLPDQSLRGQSLRPHPTAEQLREVIDRARLVAERAQVPNQPPQVVSLSDIVRREIEAGRREGAL